ncbi:flagellar assembly protein H [bacterium BMS3Bbin06]|nr:flagellar assembly protein H [bacterium BMS3Abin08]GBE33840.1 flagellar assembly protein H [bacterium BMS3Bbin06]HDO36638.1 hypothetical protein [Nitrospirota bacterium]HDY72510.1 hypothetical protein [Nitrospirota bacterium]
MSKGKVFRNRATEQYGMPCFDDIREAGESPGDYQVLETLERDAYERGYAAGEKTGFEVGQRKADLLLEGLEHIIQDLRSLKDEILKSVEPKVFKLSVGIARTIIRDEIGQHPEHIITIIRDALRKMERQGRIVIRINPAINELIDKHRAEILSIHPEITFEVDPTVSPAGPVVSGPAEEVLTDCEVQMANLLEDLGDGVGDSSA